MASNDSFADVVVGPEPAAPASASRHSSADRAAPSTNQREGDENLRVKVPANAFLLFRSSYLAVADNQVAEDGRKKTQTELTKDAAAAWRQLPQVLREVYVARAKQMLEEHKREHPAYWSRRRDHKGRFARVCSGNASPSVMISPDSIPVTGSPPSLQSAQSPPSPAGPSSLGGLSSHHGDPALAHPAPSVHFPVPSTNGSHSFPAYVPSDLPTEAVPYNQPFPGYSGHADYSSFNPNPHDLGSAPFQPSSQSNQAFSSHTLTLPNYVWDMVWDMVYTAGIMDPNVNATAGFGS